MAIAVEDLRTASEALYSLTLAAVPQADPGHRIADPDHRCQMRPIGRQRHDGRPYQQPQTAQQLRYRCWCLREQAVGDPEGWWYLEAQASGGRVLAKGKRREAPAPGDSVYTAHVAVMDTGAEVVVRAMTQEPVLTRDGMRMQTAWVRDKETLDRLGDGLLHDRCGDAVYHALYNVGLGDVAVDVTSTMPEELAQAAVEAVYERGYTPRQAATYVCRMVAGDSPWKAARIAEGRVA